MLILFRSAHGHLIIWILQEKGIVSEGFFNFIFHRLWIDELRKYEHGREPSLLKALYKMVAYKLFGYGILYIILVCMFFLRIHGDWCGNSEIKIDYMIN